MYSKSRVDNGRNPVSHPPRSRRGSTESTTARAGETETMQNNEPGERNPNSFASEPSGKGRDRRAAGPRRITENVTSFPSLLRAWKKPSTKTTDGPGRASRVLGVLNVSLPLYLSMRCAAQSIFSDEHRN